MKRSALDRLLELRRRRAEKALEVLTIRQGVHRRAQLQAEQAQNAATQHAAEAKQRERALTAALLGRDITQAALRRHQDSLDVLAHEQAALRSDADTARQDLAERGEALKQARQAYHDHRTDAEKLTELQGQERTRAARHRLVIGETIEEDQTSLVAPRPLLGL
jgi:hypothetical protein